VRVVVLNGVNLDVIGRRDPEVYGGLNIRELESKIFDWAVELELNVKCRQTNCEGEYVDWCHEALDWADGVIVNPAPGRITATRSATPSSSSTCRL
jgi:3-dehydroquinate dehydratase-2